MEIVNIKGSTFTLIRTKHEVTNMKQQIGKMNDYNIALFCHFCENPKLKQVIDFEMIDDLYFEIVGFHVKYKTLNILSDLLLELSNSELVKNYLK